MLERITHFQEKNSILIHLIYINNNIFLEKNNLDDKTKHKENVIIY
jgi:hypothetical protein